MRKYSWESGTQNTFKTDVTTKVLPEFTGNAFHWDVR